MRRIPTSIHLRAATRCRIATLVALLLLASRQPAAAATIFDQQSSGIVDSTWSYMEFSLAQTFTPAFTTIDFADLQLGCCASGPSTVRVDLRDGGVAGPVIASSMAVTLPHMTTSGLKRFTFSSTVALTPGNTYALELVYISGDNGGWGGGGSGDTYPGGRRYVNGLSTTLFDFDFRTGIFSDEPPQTGDVSAPVEYSNDLDEQALPGGGEGPQDPGQILYTEPPDDAANALPADVTDFSPGTESGNEPDLQVDALAYGVDYLYDEVVANQADLVVSFVGDSAGPAGSSDVAALREDILGAASSLYTHADLDASDGPGVVDDVDAIELWGPEGAADAFYFSRKNDALSGTSVFVDIGGTIGTFVTHAQLVSAVTTLGYTGADADIDLDALMVRNVGALEEAEFGDEILFSIRGVPLSGFDGSEIIRLPIGGTPSFLDHGGHLWDTAFAAAAAFESDSEDVDALEAFPSPVALPGLGGVGAVSLLGLGIAAAGLAALRRRR